LAKRKVKFKVKYVPSKSKHLYKKGVKGTASFISDDETKRVTIYLPQRYKSKYPLTKRMLIEHERAEAIEAIKGTPWKEVESLAHKKAEKVFDDFYRRLPREKKRALIKEHDERERQERIQRKRRKQKREFEKYGIKPRKFSLMKW